MGVALLLWAGAIGADEAARPTYAGTAICIRCHIDYARRWEALDHSQKMLDPALPPEKTGCEACHGPGSDHAAGRRERIVRWDALEVGEQSTICLKCHQGTVDAEPWQATIHAELLSCGTCHEVHAATGREAMLRGETEGSECADCHDMAAEIEAKHHHSLADGALPCAMCHAFHGSEHPSLLSAPQEEQCADCHGDDDLRPESHQAETFRLEHGAEAKADREACLTCHDDDTSCQSCHVVPVPHGEDFAIEHGEEAKLHLEACLGCHEEDYCKQCHDEIPRPEPAP